MLMTFDETIRNRHSVRGFLSTPLPQEQLRKILENAQLSPSNCNTQPWQVHIVSGKVKDSLSAAMLSDAQREHYSPDFSFDNAAYSGIYGERQKYQGKTYYEALGIARDDKEGRAKSFRRNLTFFNAPHAAFLFMPSVGDNVRVASDIGMYAQTFLLALTAQGLAGIPQTLLGFFSDTVRRELNISGDFLLLFGISFGYADTQNPANNVKMGRAAIDENIVFHG